jgi:hypothetical protein
MCCMWSNRAKVELQAVAAERSYFLIL